MVVRDLQLHRTRRAQILPLAVSASGCRLNWQFARDRYARLIESICATFSPVAIDLVIYNHLLVEVIDRGVRRVLRVDGSFSLWIS